VFPPHPLLSPHSSNGTATFFSSFNYGSMAVFGVLGLISLTEMALFLSAR
jgi:hypothetical protein